MLSAALIGACSSRKPPEPAAAKPPAPAPSTIAPETSAPEPVGPFLEALPEPVWVPAPGFRIAAPRLGQRLQANQADGLEVVVDGALDSAAGQLRVALDGHAFRTVDDHRIPLRRLLLEDEELAPGLHRLVAIRQTEAGRSLAASWFRVDASEADAEVSDELTDRAPHPGVVLAAPRGTFYGDAADDIVLDAVALHSDVFGVSGARQPIADREAILLVRLSGPSGVAERRTHGQLFRVSGLASGDHRIEARLVDARGRPVSQGIWASVERTITVNREVVEEQRSR